MVTKLNFNFYYQKKDVLTKIIVDDYETLTISEFLLKAINEYNKITTNQIIDEVSFYKVKLAKKSGKPDNDLPALSHDMTVKESNWTSFSIPLNDEHFLFGTENMNSNTISTNKDNNNVTENNEKIITKSKDESKEALSVTVKNKRVQQIDTNENEGGLCCCLLACFGKKK